jgi:O-antigen/teichoic acid export membrane protein
VSGNPQLTGPPHPDALVSPAEDSKTKGHELRALVVSGIRWKVVSQIALQGASFASTLTLARLLTPRDFGLAGAAMVFASLGLLIADVGLGSSLVQRAELTEEDRSTAFWTNVALGCALTAIGVGLSWPLGALYGEPRVQPLFAVLSLNFVITALGTTQGALLIRGLQFRNLELRTMASTCVSVAIGITFAALGYGPWAIIAQVLANSAVSSVLLWKSSSWRPRPVYSAQSLRHLLGYGGLIFGSGLVRYVERNADNFLVGRMRGAAALGAYGMAYNIMLIPILRLVNPVEQVFFPALSQVRESEMLAAVWLRMSRVLAAVVVPGLLGLVVLAPDFVTVVLGERWHSTVRVLQILAWVGMIQVAAAQATTLLQAIGRAGAALRYAVGSAILSVTGFVIGIHWGIVGVAIGYAIANTVLIPIYVAMSVRTVGMSLRQLGRAIGGVVQAATIMAAAVFGLRLLLLDELSAGPRFVLLIVAGAVIYLPLCRWRAPELVSDLRRLARPPSPD